MRVKVRSEGEVTVLVDDQDGEGKLEAESSVTYHVAEGRG